MIRWLLLLFGGALLGGIVHLATIIILPRTATQDAYSRLAPIAPVNTVTALPAPTPEKAADAVHGSGLRQRGLPLRSFAGAAEAHACRSASPTPRCRSTRDRDIAYYAINDRAAGRRVIELDLMTAEQHSQMPEDEDITAADRLIVESPTLTGLIAIRALAPEPGLMPMAQSAHRRCANAQQADATEAAIRLISAPRPGSARAPRSARDASVVRDLAPADRLSARSTSTACGDGVMITSRSSAKR